MGLKERIVSNVVRHLQTTGSFLGTAFIMKLYIIPWMINSGIVHVTVIAE